MYSYSLICLQVRVVLLQEGDLQRLHRVERPRRPKVKIRAAGKDYFFQVKKKLLLQFILFHKISTNLKKIC